MNRLRGKKKNREDSLAPRPSMDYEPSGPFRIFGKKKSQEDEPKKELDLTAALPSTDDFRTSLLMTGLSARFSMLREQDDPKSKLGKASDDSVLYPKRQSRLGVGDFGLGAGLHEIAEFDSVKARHFACVDSYVSSDDTASTNGSIMNRAKPTEGNNLFGGRQKIYKIPVGGAAKGGGMGGKALYDDDVAQSAFQRWRQAEKDRQSFEQDRIREAVEPDGQLDYTRRRETSSTTSSGPSAARSSSATTSVISQSASVKEWQASSTTPSFTAQISGLERSVTRNRRLYEQGLSQDLHDQQSSALSRMDTLSRKRPLGSRTPERTPLAPSPTGSGFGDRVQERRNIATKVSAPNLRSYSPPRTGATYAMSPPEKHSKFSKPEHKPGFIGNPPLSPPISEAEDYSVLPIQSNDRGKATAMGVFQRPAHQYDESKYAQRQRQLQEGRETPTSQHTELASLNGVVRSHSSSSKRTPSDGMALSTSQKDGPSLALVDESDDSSVGNRLSGPPVAPQLTIQRSNDQDHPALRKSALPTPLSFRSCVLGDEGEGFNPGSKSAIPPDLPTLGPASGLNGMVRKHLRHDSVSSSVSGFVDGETTSPFTETSNKKAGGAYARDQDEFARHLADGARRVRERLTTFIETDNDRFMPTTPLSETSKDGHVGRANGLGILRSRMSRSSLLDHEATRSHRSRSLTVQASGASMVGSPAPLCSPSATSSEETAKNRLGSGSGEQARDKHPSVGKDDHAQAGLKAFRQARREFQKMKELEAQQRHQKPTGAAEGTSSQQTNSHDGCASPTMVGRRPQEESRNSSRSRAGSHATTDSRERSDSETSNGASFFGRGVRLRNGSTTHDDQASHLVRRSPRGMGGSAGFPGADAGATVFSSGMSPSHSTGAIEASGRRMVSKRDAADAKTAASTAGRPSTHCDSQPYVRSRKVSLLGAAASTPNLHAATSAAPPLPPINPRRKNGQATFARPLGAHPPLGSGMDESYASVATSDDEGAYPHGLRRVILDGAGRKSPPCSRGMPLHANVPRNGQPGGMI